MNIQAFAFRANFKKGDMERLPAFVLKEREAQRASLRRTLNSVAGRAGAIAAMATMAENVMGRQAQCYVDSDATTPVYRRQRGMASTAITRNSAGNYSLTLNEPIATATDGDVLIGLTVNSSALACAAVELVSTTVLRTLTAAVTVVPAVTAADLDYWLTVEQFGPN